MSGTSGSQAGTGDARLKRVAARVVGLNLGYFGVEFAVALAIGSVALFADSVDFLEDTSINLLVLLALRLSAPKQARVGFVLGALLLVPGAAALITAWTKLHTMAPPAPLPLTLAGLGALAVNLACAVMLARFRRGGGSLVRAAFLSARNDVIAGVAIVLTGCATAWLNSAWPDILVGIGIALLNLDAAREVWQAAHAERRALEA